MFGRFSLAHRECRRNQGVQVMGLTTRFGAASMDRRSPTEPSALNAVSPGVGWERMGPRTVR
jgi:hypothetical protein